MTQTGLTLLRRGKVKDIYEMKDGRLLFHFTDRVSAFDVVLPTKIPRKGEVLCKFALFWFDYLKTPHHMLSVEPPDRMVVKRLRMIPVECVVRGYLYGSLYERVKKGQVKLDVESVLAGRLGEPVFDPTTKSEEKDVPVAEQEILMRGWLDKSSLKTVRSISMEVYKKMAVKASNAGFILADLKLEFGFDEEGSILLADSIGPDEFRLWLKSSYAPGQSQESYDKQPVRDWLEKIGYKRKLDEARANNTPLPDTPNLPTGLVEETTRRYVDAYEKISGTRL